MANKEKNFISAVIYVHNIGGGGGENKLLVFCLW